MSKMLVLGDLRLLHNASSSRLTLLGEVFTFGPPPPPLPATARAPSAPPAASSTTPATVSNPSPTDASPAAMSSIPLIEPLK